jgi:hypothetical protein
VVLGLLDAFLPLDAQLAEVAAQASASIFQDAVSRLSSFGTASIPASMARTSDSGGPASRCPSKA